MARHPRPTLEPRRDVELSGGGFRATSVEPWLRIAGIDIGRLAGQFVEITYRTSLWDEPVRPVFQFASAAGDVIERLAAGPIVGSAIWIGRVPSDTIEINVSPTNRPGRFDFAIELIRVRRWPALLALGLRRNPRSTRSALFTRLIGWKPEADNNLDWAIGATPAAAFVAWRKSRQRSIDLAGFEKPRFDWSAAREIFLVMPCANAAADAVQITCTSLAAQVFPRWRLLAVDGATAVPRDERIVMASGAAAELLAQVPSGTLVGQITPGDRLLPEALAYLAEQAARYPDRHMFYGDAIHVEVGRRRRPHMLPGWSPRLQAGLPYMRNPVFVRAKGHNTAAEEKNRNAFQTGATPDDFAQEMASGAVMPLRRFLVETQVQRRHPARPRVIAPTSLAVSVIIPTRDHPALLERAIKAVKRTTAHRTCEIVVVDNGSETPDAKGLLTTLRTSHDVLVLDRPGPFNFSKMCNDAAAASRGDILVFLNDDTEVLSEDWLDRLCSHAINPVTGAVGAKLTYPDGRLQHVGVLLGMGGSAGHFGAPAAGDDPGWAARNLCAHEVSAVTGACLTVERQKFEAVGRFDEADLPIELSDIDLCLKLNARGWQTIVDPAVHIMHEESASRGGATFRRLTVHDRERAVFLDRWRHVLRDDPFFHPGLSLYSWREALG